MMIRNYDSDYIVIRHIQSGSVKDIYLCRRSSEKNGREYTVIRIKDIALCQQLLRFFSDEVDERKFTDFVECFTSGGRLNFVFLHSSAMTLPEKLLREDCLFAERLEIAHKILERIVCLNMPYVFCADALWDSHVTVSAGLDVRFNYELSYLDRLHDYTIREAGLAIDDKLRRIFAPETQMKSCPEIDEFLGWLENGEYNSYLDIFYKFNRYYSLLKKKSDEELLTPHTGTFRAWEVMKKFFGVLKRLLMFALIIGAVAYLVASIMGIVIPAKEETDVQPVDRYDYIGTVQIQDGESIPDSSMETQ